MLRPSYRHPAEIPAPEGHDLVREGAPGLEFYLVVDGHAKVTRRGRKVGELGPGSFFGELAVLVDRPRNATVTALGPMEVIVLTRREFTAALEEAPRLSRKIMTGMAARLADADSKL